MKYQLKVLSLPPTDMIFSLGSPEAWKRMFRVGWQLQSCTGMIGHIKLDTKSWLGLDLLLNLCRLLFPLFTNPLWSVAMIKGKHSPFAGCFACTHACGHYLGVTSTCGPAPSASQLMLRAGIQMCESWTCSRRHAMERPASGLPRPLPHDPDGERYVGICWYLNVSSMSLFSQLVWFAVLLPVNTPPPSNNSLLGTLSMIFWELLKVLF